MELTVIPCVEQTEKNTRNNGRHFLHNCFCKQTTNILTYSMWCRKCHCPCSYRDYGSGVRIFKTKLNRPYPRFVIKKHI